MSNREIVQQALGSHAMLVKRVGSRETCDPAPTDTDEDWLILVDEDITSIASQLKRAGWKLGGAHREIAADLHDEDRDGSRLPELGWRSLKKGEINLLVTDRQDYYDKFVLATHVAKRLNLLSKADRIVLFQAILYGEMK